MAEGILYRIWTEYDFYFWIDENSPRMEIVFGIRYSNGRKDPIAIFSIDKFIELLKQGMDVLGKTI